MGIVEIYENNGTIERMTEKPDKMVPKLDTRFQKGQSGNPKGRKQGSRNKASLLLAELIDGQGEKIVQSMIRAALDGDTSAGRCLIDRLVAPRKDRPVCFELPPLVTASDRPKAMAAITAAVASGDLTASEASDLAGLVDRFVRVVETADLAAQIQELKNHVGLNVTA